MTQICPASVIVVGGGIAGISAVAALRTGGFKGDLTVIDKAELPYDRPPLSKEYLTGALDLKQIALQQPEWYVEQRIQLVGPAEVVAIQPDTHAVEVALHDGRTCTADRVILATGGRAAVPPIPGVADVANAGRMHVLRDVEHADRLRAVLGTGARILIVGGGLIGAETASTARSLGCEVTLVDPLDPPLLAAGRSVARWLHAEHARRGIDTRATTVASFDAVGDVVVAHLADGTTADADAVLLGVGMCPSVELAAAAGLETDRGVVVDERQLTSHPLILAIGDVSQRRGRRPTEHWEAAQQDGHRAAATLLGTSAPGASASWWWSDRHGVHVEGVGVMSEPDDAHTLVVRGSVGVPPFSAFTVSDGRITGAIAVNDSQTVRAARRMIDRQIAVDPVRLSDPETDLRKLLRN